MIRLLLSVITLAVLLAGSTSHGRAKGELGASRSAVDEPAEVAPASTETASGKEASAESEKARDESVTRGSASTARTLDAITIEGELDMPQVLFISARDQYRYMDHLHRRYQLDCATIGKEARLPRRLELMSKEN
jgi:hypothetical protein